MSTLLVVGLDLNFDVRVTIAEAQMSPVVNCWFFELINKSFRVQESSRCLQSTLHVWAQDSLVFPSSRLLLLVTGTGFMVVVFLCRGEGKKFSPEFLWD